MALEKVASSTDKVSLARIAGVSFAVQPAQGTQILPLSPLTRPGSFLRNSTVDVEASLGVPASALAGILISFPLPV
jgi:hypothetical protein